MPDYPTAEATCVLRQAFNTREDEIQKRGAVNNMMLQLADLVNNMGVRGLSLKHVHIPEWEPKAIYWEWRTPDRMTAYFHVEWLRITGPRFRTEKLVEVPEYFMELEWDEDNDRLEYGALGVVARSLVTLTPDLPKPHDLLPLQP